MIVLQQCHTWSTINQNLAILARQVSLFYCSSFTYSSQNFHHIFCMCLITLFRFLNFMPPKRTTRSSTKPKTKAKSAPKARTVTPSKSSKSTPKLTKTQAVKDRRAQRSQARLQALKKKHAQEAEDVDDLIEEAQNMPIEIRDSDSSSSSSSSDSDITQSAFARSTRSRKAQREARKKQRKLNRRVVSLEAAAEEKKTDSGDDDEGEVFDSNDDSSDATSTTLHEDDKSHSEDDEDSSDDDEESGEDDNDEVNSDEDEASSASSVNDDDATVVPQRNKTTKKVPEIVLPKRRHIVFCKGKLTIPKCGNSTPCDRLRAMFMSYYTTLLKIDKSMLIFDFNDSSNKRYLSAPQQIPETPQNIKAFFDGSYRPKPDAQVIWIQLRIGIDLPEADNFFIDAKCLFDHKGKHALFKKDLQVCETETVGYLLFSHPKQSRDRLQSMLTSLLLTNYKVRHPISIRWQKVTTRMPGVPFQPSASAGGESKAYHVETVLGAGNSISKAIGHIYSSRRSDFPSNEKLRFVPYPQFVQNTQVKIQYSEIRAMQYSFTYHTSFAPSFDIINLDTQYTGLDCTLRELIMSFDCGKDKQLFNTVDFAYNGKSVLFVFPKAYQDTALNKIADLPSYAYFRFGLRFLQKYFTPEALQRAEDAPWNEEEQRAVSKLSEEFDNILQECGEISWLVKPDTSTTKETENAQNIQKPALFNINPTDDKSLGTFGANTQESSQKRTVSPDKEAIHDRAAKKMRVIGSDVVMSEVNDVGDLTEDDDTDDDATVATLQSKIHQMENNFQAMSTNFQNMENNIANTIQAQFQQFLSQKSPSGTNGTSKTRRSTRKKRGTRKQTSSTSVAGGGR